MSDLTHSQPPSACPNSHNTSLLVHLCIHSTSVLNGISKLAGSLPRSLSGSSLDFGLLVHVLPRFIMDSQWIYVSTWSWSEIASGYSLDHGLMIQAEGAKGIIYSRDPWVHRYHFILIPSYHIMKIRTLSFPTFALTSSIPDLVDPRNCVEPHGRVVSYPLPFFLSICS